MLVCQSDNEFAFPQLLGEEQFITPFKLICGDIESRMYRNL